MSVVEFQNFFQDSVNRRAPAMPSTELHPLSHRQGSLAQQPPPPPPPPPQAPLPPPPPPLASPPQHSAEMPWETETLDLVKSCLSTARSGMTITEVFRRLD